MLPKKPDQFSTIIQKLGEIKSKSDYEENEVYLLYKLATTDQKTSLYNYRFFVSILEKEIERSVRYQRLFSLFLIDVDNFKHINEVHGHLKGDVLLERLAKVVQKNIRMNDTAARFGGEEFIILLPETDERKARQIAERLRIKVIEDQVLANCDVTISAGITYFSGKSDKMPMQHQNYQKLSAEIIKQADSALALAKNTGKNKCVVYSDQN